MFPFPRTPFGFCISCILFLTSVKFPIQTSQKQNLRKTISFHPPKNKTKILSFSDLAHKVQVMFWEKIDNVARDFAAKL